MTDHFDQLKAWLNRIPTRPVDPSQTQTYLLDRGRRVADGLDLGQINDQDLTELGRLDVLGTMPDLDQGLAPTLAMVTDHWHQGLAQNQHELDHDLGQAHDHGRLRETGVDLGQDHDRIQLLGHDRHNGHDQDQDQDQDQRLSMAQPLGPRSEHPNRERDLSPRAGPCRYARCTRIKQGNQTAHDRGLPGRGPRPLRLRGVDHDRGLHPAHDLGRDV